MGRLAGFRYRDCQLPWRGSDTRTYRRRPAHRGRRCENNFSGCFLQFSLTRQGERPLRRRSTAHRFCCPARSHKLPHLGRYFSVFGRSGKPTMRHSFPDMKMGLHTGTSQRSVHVYRVRQEQISSPTLNERARKAFGEVCEHRRHIADLPASGSSAPDRRPSR